MTRNASIDAAPLLHPLSEDEAAALVEARARGGVALSRLLSINLARGWLVVVRTPGGYGWRLTDAGFDALKRGDEVAVP